MLSGIPSGFVVPLQRLLPGSGGDARLRLAIVENRARHMNGAPERTQYTSGKTSVAALESDARTPPLRRKPRATYGGQTRARARARGHVIRATRLFAAAGLPFALPTGGYRRTRDSPSDSDENVSRRCRGITGAETRNLERDATDRPTLLERSSREPGHVTPGAIALIGPPWDWREIRARRIQVT